MFGILELGRPFCEQVSPKTSVSPVRLMPHAPLPAWGFLLVEAVRLVRDSYWRRGDEAVACPSLDLTCPTPVCLSRAAAVSPKPVCPPPTCPEVEVGTDLVLFIVAGISGSLSLLTLCAFVFRTHGAQGAATARGVAACPACAVVGDIVVEADLVASLASFEIRLQPAPWSHDAECQ